MFGVDPLRALTHQVVASMLDLLTTVRPADLLDRVGMQVLAEG
jgi:hypothetical protein